MSEKTFASGSLISSINDLSKGRSDVSEQSKLLQSNLDALLATNIAREKMYTDAVNSFLDNYNNVLKEASIAAEEMKVTASAEAVRIITTAEQKAESVTSAAQQEAAEWEVEKAKLSVVQHFEPRIKLDVGGVRCTTSLTTLRRFPDTMIGAMFSGRHALPLDEDGYHFIDRDGTHFRYILNFLRAPENVKIEITGSDLAELKSECEYYGLLELMFRFIPIPAFTLSSPQTYVLTVTQDPKGIFMVNNVPLRMCKHCGVPDYSTGNVSGHCAAYCYLAGFPAALKGKGGVIVPEQPQLATACKACGRA